MKKRIILFTIGILILGTIAYAYNERKISQSNLNKSPTKIVELANKEETKEQKQIDEKEKEEKLQKNIDNNNVVHANLIKEMKTDFPNITKIYIVDTEEGKTMNITIPLENNKDMTIHKCAEITTFKETKMKNEGITNINIKIDNNEEHAGFIFFALRSGRYEPTLNTLK